MNATRAAAALAAVLAGLAAAPAPAPGRVPVVTVSSFPGPPQPDPGTDPAPSRSGRVVAFASSVRVDGARYDPAATPTVFLWDRRLGTLRQVTASGPSDQPAAENGTAAVPVGTATDRTVLSRTLVAFRSTADLAGGNADGSAEIFVWDSLGGGITQITSAASGASSDPAIGARFRAERDANGRFTGNMIVRYRVAFLSTADLTGDNPGGLSQVFLYDSGLPPVERLVQVSHSTTGAAGPPAIDGAGDRIAFVHDGSLLPDDVPGTAYVYCFSRLHGLRNVSGGWDQPEDVTMDSSGRYVAFTSPAGSPARSILVLDSRSGRLQFGIGGDSLSEPRAPSLGRGPNRLAYLRKNVLPAAAPDSPVFSRFRGNATTAPLDSADLGSPGPAYGRPRMLAGRPRVLFTSDGDLDGTNSAGRTVLFEAGIHR